MGLDIWLVIIAGGTQLLMAVLGIIWTFRPPRPALHRPMTALFAVIGVIGLVATAWGAIRSSESQDSVSSGVVQMRASQDIHFHKIETQLAAIGRGSETAKPDQKAPLASKPAASQPRSGPSSRLVVDRFLLGETSGSPPSYFINVYLTNRGAIPADAPVTTFSFDTVATELSASDIDKRMSEVVATALRKPPNARERDQIEAGSSVFFTLSRGIVQDAYSDIATGKRHFYLFVVLVYSDPSLQSGDYWVSEYCGTPAPDFSSIQVCKSRIWLYRSKS